MQLVENYGEDTIDGLANSLLETVNRSVNDQNKFYLVAHSYGTVIAIKLAALLEKTGKIGHLMLIDGSPIFVKQMIEGVARATQHDHGDDQLSPEDTRIMMIFDHGGSGERDTFTAKLAECTSYDSKVELLVDFLSHEIKSAYSVEYLKKVCISIMNRLKMGMNMNVESDAFAGLMDAKLKSEIILIRPKIASFAGIAEDYGLQGYSEQPITIHHIDGTHMSVLENSELADIINEVIGATNTD